jgi:hypothetical protein
MARTGPRSPQAKAIVSTNAIRHGLRSPRIVIPGLESQADWETFLAGVIEYLQPVGAVEYAQAERIATLQWRLRRASRAERDAAIALARRSESSFADSVDGMILLMERMRGAFFPESQPFNVGPALESASAPLPPPRGRPRILPEAKTFEAISRYEYRYSRQLDRAYHEYYAMQDRRNGKHVPIAHVDVDVQGLPERD